MKLIDGKAISAQIRSELAENTKKLKEEKGIVPGLAVIIVGEDPASQIYVRNKARACEELGFHSEVYRLPAETPEAELEALIDKLNVDASIHGILVPYNVGRISTGDTDFCPAHPQVLWSF